MPWLNPAPEATAPVCTYCSNFLPPLPVPCSQPQGLRGRRHSAVGGGDGGDAAAGATPGGAPRAAQREGGAALLAFSGQAHLPQSCTQKEVCKPRSQPLPGPALPRHTFLLSSPPPPRPRAQVDTHIAYLHIPPIQVLEVWNNESTRGFKDEPSGCSQVDSGAFAALR